MKDKEAIAKMVETVGFEVRRDEIQDPDGSVDVTYILEFTNGEEREATYEEVELWEVLRAFTLENLLWKARVRCLESVVRDAEALCKQVEDAPIRLGVDKAHPLARLIRHTIVILESDGTLSKGVV
jgi:hypothetical protein